MQNTTALLFIFLFSSQRIFHGFINTFYVISLHSFHQYVWTWEGGGLVSVNHCTTWGSVPCLWHLGHSGEESLMLLDTLLCDNSLEPIVCPSICSFVCLLVNPFIRQNYLWAPKGPFRCSRRLKPSVGARKKPPVGGLNF